MISTRKPMGWISSALFFGIPGIWMLVNMHFLLPRLLKGLPLFGAVFLSLWGPVTIFAGAVLLSWRRDKSPFRGFFWISGITKKQGLLIFAAFILVQAAELALEPTRGIIGNLSVVTVPSHYPALFTPSYAIEIPLNSFLGMDLPGRWPPLFLWLLWLIFNIGGEELLWRGYALPRMEQYFGKYAWLVNGLLWNIVVHAFMPWAWVSLLPVSLVVPYLSQRMRSLWPGVLIHGGGNLLVYAILIPSVLS